MPPWTANARSTLTQPPRIGGSVRFALEKACYTVWGLPGCPGGPTPSNGRSNWLRPAKLTAPSDSAPAALSTLLPAASACATAASSNTVLSRPPPPTAAARHRTQPLGLREVDARYIAGRWRPVVWLAHRGRAGSVGKAVRLASIEPVGRQRGGERSGRGETHLYCMGSDRQGCIALTRAIGRVRTPYGQRADFTPIGMEYPQVSAHRDG